MGRGLNSYSNARDGNESRIVNLLRDMHLRVDRHDRPWDLCVCGPLGLLWRWAEVKIIKGKRNPRPDRFTPKQLKTLETWPTGMIDVLWTDDSAIEFARKLRKDELLLIRCIKGAAE